MVVTYNPETESDVFTTPMMVAYTLSNTLLILQMCLYMHTLYCNNTHFSLLYYMHVISHTHAPTGNTPFNIAVAVAPIAAIAVIFLIILVISPHL